MTLYIEQGFSSAVMQPHNNSILDLISNYDGLEITNELSDADLKNFKRYNAEYLISGEMADTRRNDNNLISRDVIAIDYDFNNNPYDAVKITHEELTENVSKALDGYNYAMYPSISASAQKARYHVLVPVDRQLSKPEYEVMLAAIAERINIPIDQAMFNWSQPIGLPITTPNNKELFKTAITDGKTFETKGKADLIARHESGAVAKFKQSNLVLNPITPTKNQNTTENINIMNIPDSEALAIAKDYIEHEKDNLQARENYLSAISVLAKAVKDQSISYDVAEQISEMLAVGNAEWERENVEHFKKEYKNTNQRTDYSFYNKFVLSIGNSEKFPVGASEEDIKNITASIDFENDTIDQFNSKALAALEFDKRKQLNHNTSSKNQISKLREMINRNTESQAIPTGFKQLDAALDGGLYAGLYFIGAVSSMGKTTFLLQLADQIAEAGTDVIIFSLEMSRFEIMTKTLSRLTHIISKEDGRESYHITDGKGYDVFNARSMREITELRRYDGYIDSYGKKQPSYTDYQKELIERAFERYEQDYAEHIYIHENNNKRITMSDIENTVNNHIEVTGNKPLVIVDYLQIIAPDDKKADARFNIDDAVTRLKVLSTQNSIPVMAISSFNRDSYKESVSMTSFKESGGIEYSSDVLIGLQFAKQREIDKKNSIKARNAPVTVLNTDEERKKTPREMELKILKQRNGEAPVSMDFQYYSKYQHYIEKRAGFTYTSSVIESGGKSKLPTL